MAESDAEDMATSGCAAIILCLPVWLIAAVLGRFVDVRAAVIFLALHGLYAMYHLLREPQRS